MKHINIPTFNHELVGIGDQINSIKEIFDKIKLNIKIQKKIDTNTHNIIIENFNILDVNEIISKVQILKRNNYKIFILLTEHMEKDINNNLYLNGELCHLEREYIPNLYERFINLVRVSSYIDGFLVLYSQPDPTNVAKIFPNTPIFDLGVDLELVIEINAEIDKKYDFCFIGNSTKYRKYIIDLISKKYKIFSGHGLDEGERKKIITNSRYNLNIPQTAAWTYISPMRINSAAKYGSFTVNVMDAAIHYPNTIPVPITEIIENNIEYIDRMVMNAKKSQFNNKVIFNNNLKTFLAWLN